MQPETTHQEVRAVYLETYQAHTVPIKKYLQLELNEATSVVQIAHVVRNHREFDHEQAFSPNLRKALILEALQMEASLKRTAHFGCSSSGKTIYT